MFQGDLIGIFIASRRGVELQAVDAIEAIAGRGLVGDRYFLPEGENKPDKEVTLIESEALGALADECEIRLGLGQSRRNLVTRGVPLNHLVGKEFQVGAARLRGLRLCEPCGHLEKLTVKGVQGGLCHRGGLRAQILVGGTLHVGDSIGPWLAR
jgi:MOSC domain-containing protein YiiM